MKYGTNAFVERPKGRIPTMSRTDEKAKITTHTKSRNQKKKKELTPEQARILELEKQLRYAQIENAYLKELRRLRLEDARKMKEQQESLAVSEAVSYTHLDVYKRQTLLLQTDIITANTNNRLFIITLPLTYTVSVIHNISL